MKKIILDPLNGIKILKEEIIELGISKKKLFDKIGKPSSRSDNQFFYDEFELRINLDKEEKIEFIEFIYGPFPKKTEIEIYGVNPFKTKSLDLIQILTENNDGKIDDSEAPYSYAFLETSIGVFRDSCEDDIEEMIIEMKNLGKYSENQEWILDDKEKAKYFWTIGLGIENYYK